MITRIETKQLGKLLETGYDLVDVREPEELDGGEIPGGKNWPLSSFGSRQKEISQKRPTIFYCRSGVRSVVAAEIAEKWTDQELYSLDGGFLDYSDSDSD